MRPPTGTVTFLFTDIEGSTRLWETSPGAMRAALTAHDRLARGAIEGAGGVIFKTMGDAFCAAFAVAGDALTAAVAVQRALSRESLVVGDDALRVRIAVHSGTATFEEGDYLGQPLNRVARIVSVAHGGQIVVSLATRELCGGDAIPSEVTLQPLGSHRLKDLARPEPLFQACHPDLPAAFPPLRSLTTTPNNLPEQLTSFIGREAELARVRSLIAGGRMVTLVGSGGCGKTRLSLQAAAECLGEYPDGVFFAELAPVTDGSRVAQTVAAAVGVRDEGRTPLIETLTRAITACHLLIVLDNCEHLIGECARFTETILRACPRVTILASSRESLGIGGEAVCRVPSLSLPEPDAPATARTIGQYEAVRLFVERASSVCPGFAVTDQSAAAVAQICYQLDGIPLAIELAAARVRTLSVSEIAPRLSDRFRLLTGGSRTALRRQQTLRGLIDWSYDLLGEEERLLLARLSVFPGGFTLAASETVCVGGSLDAWRVLDALGSLVDKSLVLRDAGDGEGGRYRLIQTVREYAAERLRERGGETPMRERHAAYYAALAAPWAERAERDLNVIAVLPRYLPEQEHIRHALAHLRERHESGDGGATETLLALLRNYVCVWGFLGYYAEAEAWLPLVTAVAEAEAVSDATRDAADAVLSRTGFMHETRRDAAAAGAVYETLLRLRERRSHQSEVARAHLKIGDVAGMAGRFEEALARYERGLALLETGDDVRGAVWAMEKLAYLHFQLQSDNAAARHWFERGLALSPDSPILLDGLGMVASFENDFDRARVMHERALAARRLANNDSQIANSLNMCGTAARERGDFPEALRLHGEALAIQKPFAPGFAFAHSLGLHALAALGAGDTEAARAALGESLAVARATGHRVQIVTALYRLAQAAIQDGTLDEAGRLLGEAWEAVEAVRDSRETARTLARFAYLARARGEEERAARILGAAEGLRRTPRERLFLYRHEEAAHEAARIGLCESLGEVRFAAAFAAGIPLGRSVIG